MRKKILLFVLIIFVIDSSLSAQSDTLYANRLISVDKEFQLDSLMVWFKKKDNHHFPKWNYYPTAKKLAFQTLSSSEAKIWCFDFLFQFQLSFARHKNQKLAKEVFTEMKTLAEGLSSEGNELYIAKWYAHYGYLLYQHFYQKEIGEENYKRGLEIARKIDDKELIFLLLNRLGLAANIHGHWKEALLYYNEAVEIEKNNKIRRSHYLKLNADRAYLYFKLKKYNESIKVYESFIDSMDILNDRIKIEIRCDFAEVINTAGYHKRALRIMSKDKYFVDQASIPYLTMYFTEPYTAILNSNGLLKEARQIFVPYRKLVWEDEKEILKEDNIAHFSQIEANAKDYDLKLLKQKNELISTQNNNKLRILVLLGIFGILATGFILYNIRNKRKQLEIAIITDKEIMQNRNLLFSSITHDIRTPLTLMMGPLERALSSVDSPSVKQNIKLAQKQGKNLMTLFTQILDWNKSESNNLIFNPQAGNLQVIMAQMVTKFETIVLEKGHELVYTNNLPSKLFKSDYDKIEKIISQLIDNSIKFSAANSIINLNMALENSETERLQIDIQDNGVGILEEEKNKIFEKYFQGIEGKKRKGSGIGLTLVNELINLLQGQISLQTEQAKGCHFKILIPIEKATSKPVSISNETGLQESNSNKEYQLLIIEDDVSLCEFLTTSLVNQNFKVAKADSAEIGIHLLENINPDLVICDWNLPNNNGGWFCQTLRTNFPELHIPVIILSGLDDIETKNQAFEKGGNAWVLKPFDLKLLVKQIHSMISQNKSYILTSEKKSINSSTVIEKVEQSWFAKIPNNSDPFVSSILTNIDSNHSNSAFNVSELSKNIDLNRVALSNKLYALTGFRPAKLILECRMRKAAELLGIGKFNSSEVASQIGFKNPDYFSTAYKKFHGHSPNKDLKK